MHNQRIIQKLTLTLPPFATIEFNKSGLLLYLPDTGIDDTEKEACLDGHFAHRPVWRKKTSGRADGGGVVLALLSWPRTR